MADLLESSKALLDLDARNALTPHGLGGHGRTCLTWCVEEIERLRETVERYAIAMDMISLALAPVKDKGKR